MGAEPVTTPLVAREPPVPGSDPGGSHGVLAENTVKLSRFSNELWLSSCQGLMPQITSPDVVTCFRSTAP